MSSYKFVGDLFQEEPENWGLRGDPYLWKDMRSYFSSTAITSVGALKAEIEKAFLDLTGHEIDSKNEIEVKKYALGGMSSGYIYAPFWRDIAIPLLLLRAESG